MPAGTKPLSKGVQTSRVEAKKGNPLSRLSAYIDELKREMRLVTWPSRQQVRSTTIVVIVTVAFFGVYFGIVDYVLALGQTKLYQIFSN